MRGLRLLGVMLVLGLTLAARSASAGLLSRGIDLVYLAPFLGAETVRLGSADLGSLQAGSFVTSGLTVGGTAGVRLGPLSLGVLLQRTEVSDPGRESFTMQKVYFELGINASYGIVNVPVHFDFGYAYLDSAGFEARGPGGKIGIGIDVYPTRILSLGVGVDLDLQAYDKDNRVVGGYGGSFTGRIGLHL